MLDVVERLDVRRAILRRLGRGGGGGGTGGQPTAESNLPTEIGEGEGELSLIAWSGYVESGENYPAYDWRTEGKIKNYWDMYTLNDGLAGTVSETLLAAHRVYDDSKYLGALSRLGDFLIRAQLPDPQPAWAQQYNFDMHPAWARRFEPASITGGGFASRHDPDGDYLYGMEMCVDREFRGLRIGQRLYNARKKLCMAWRLRGIIISGRLAGFAKRRKRFLEAQAYVDAVVAGEVRDATITPQLSQGFEVLRLLPDYLPSDAASLGYGLAMIWRNPSEPADEREYRRRGHGARRAI